MTTPDNDTTIPFLDNLYTSLNKTLYQSKQTILKGEAISYKISGQNAYLTLKINNYEINCICWRIITNNILSKLSIKTGETLNIDGQFKILKNKLSIYFDVTNITKSGLGNYVLQQNDNREKIFTLGFHNNKKLLIKTPLNIGIITALGGAAIQDILQVFKNDNFIGNIIIKSALVQGKQCSDSVIAGIKYFENYNVTVGVNNDNSNSNNCVKDGFNNNNCVKDGFNNNNCVKDGFNNDNCVKDGFNNNNCVKDGLNNNNYVKDSVNNNNCVKDGFNNKNCKIDVLLITRGGGSYEDLIEFSNWKLIEYINQSNINNSFITISAVGHQIDNQLTDNVCSYSFATPSIASKFIVETQQNKFKIIQTSQQLLNKYKIFITNFKAKHNTITKKYNQIIYNYEIKQSYDKLRIANNFIKNTIKKYEFVKNNFHKKLTLLKPTIYKKREIESIYDLVDVKEELNPKLSKMDLIFHDGKIKIAYKVVSYDLF